MSRDRFDKLLPPSLKQRVWALIDVEGERGLTVAELRRMAPTHHHGKLSGALSTLHKDGQIARLAEDRHGNRIYVTAAHVAGRKTEAQGTRPGALPPDNMDPLWDDDDDLL